MWVFNVAAVEEVSHSSDVGHRLATAAPGLLVLLLLHVAGVGEAAGAGGPGGQHHLAPLGTERLTVDGGYDAVHLILTVLHFLAVLGGKRQGISMRALVALGW